MSTYGLPREPAVCNTTPIRYFALVGQLDLLAEVLGGRIHVPRQVLDPEEDPDGVSSLLSEIGQSERYWARRSRTANALEKWSRLRALRQRSDLEIVDLDEDEVAAFAELVSWDYARAVGLTLPLGAGEAAVIAVAENRAWPAVLDDAEARRILHERAPATRVATSRDLLRQCVALGRLTSPEAEIVYLDMTEEGYRGPDSLWSNGEP